jgi:hypothetical protein
VPAIQAGNQYAGAFATNEELSIYGGLPIPDTPFSIGIGLSWPNPWQQPIDNFGTAALNQLNQAVSSNPALSGGKSGKCP